MKQVVLNEFCFKYQFLPLLSTFWQFYPSELSAVQQIGKNQFVCHGHPKVGNCWLRPQRNKWSQEYLKKKQIHLIASSKAPSQFLHYKNFTQRKIDRFSVEFSSSSVFLKPGAADWTFDAKNRALRFGALWVWKLRSLKIRSNFSTSELLKDGGGKTNEFSL